MWVPQKELLRAPAASSTDSIPAGFHSHKLWGLIFLALESWARGPGMGQGLLTPKISLPNLIHMGVRPACSNAVPLLPVLVNVVSSIQKWSDIHSTQFCNCQTSIQPNFWCSWMMVVLYFSCNFLVVVRRGEPCLPMSPSWSEAPSKSFYLLSLA